LGGNSGHISWDMWRRASAAFARVHPQSPLHDRVHAEALDHPGRKAAPARGRQVRHVARVLPVAVRQAAYLEIELGGAGRYNKVRLDFELALLLRGAELAALAEPRAVHTQIKVD